MAKYRKITKIVDAEQFFVAKKPWPKDVWFNGNWHYLDSSGLRICDGDWVIPEDGLFNPCKPDIFEQTYEKV